MPARRRRHRRPGHRPVLQRHPAVLRRPRARRGHRLARAAAAGLSRPGVPAPHQPLHRGERQADPRRARHAADELARRARLDEARALRPARHGERGAASSSWCRPRVCSSRRLAAVWIAWRAGWVLGDRVSWLLVAPIVVLTLTLNWDALALLATAAALIAWQRHRMVWFGALVALGTAAKLFPLVLLAAGLILAIRARSSRAVVAMTTSFVIVTLAANLPLYLSDAERGVSSGPRTPSARHRSVRPGWRRGWSGCPRAPTS